MAFSREDIEEFIEALHHDAELRDRVRDAILEDDFRALPGIVRQLGERIDSLTQQISLLTSRMDWAAGKIGNLDGWRFEETFLRHLSGRIGPTYRRPQLMDLPAENAVLSALDAGTITKQEYTDLGLVDAAARAREKGATSDVIVVLEVSILLDRGDVQRAHDRAQILARVYGEDVHALVAGQAISLDAEALARELGVRVFATPSESAA